MNIEELAKECLIYMERVKKINPTFFSDYQNARNFCRKINSEISDDCYLRMREAYDYIRNEELSGHMTKEEIIEMVKLFFGDVSLSLKDRFISDLNNGLISIEKNNQSKCSYLSKTINGVTKNYCKVYIKYTGTVFDVLVLVHEFFHSLTDVIDYKRKVKLDKNTLDYIQETISILAEFICLKYFDDTYPIEMQKNLLCRVYEEIYINVQSAEILMRYLNAVMSGMNVDDLNKKFNVEEIREFIHQQKFPFSKSHFVGTMISITKIDNIEDSIKLLKSILEKIEKEELEHINEIIPMVLNASKVVDCVNVKKLKNSN